MTVPSADPRSAQRAALRRAVLSLVLWVVALDAVAISVFYAAGIDHWPNRSRTLFLIAWSIATAIVVGVQLRKVRRVRMAGRR